MWTSLWLSVALASGLALESGQQPQVEPAPDWAPEGAVSWRLPQARRPVVVLRQVVVGLLADVEVPELVAEGTRLGPATSRSWLVPAGDRDLAELTQELLALPGVEVAFPDVVAPLTRTEVSFDDPHYESQWYLEHLEAGLGFALSLGSSDIRVAVIDSGIELDHPDLAEAFVEPYDAFSDDDDPNPDRGEYCYDGSDDYCDGHGTSVSGIIGARSNNAEGIVGLCSECLVVPIKMLGEGLGNSSASVAAFEHAIASDADVINNSWGYTTATAVPTTMARVIERAATEGRDGKGAVVVFAAGNDNRDIEDDEMQAMEEVICVSATDAYNLPTAYTNSGASVDVSAPSATYSTDVGGGYTATFGGTSAAAPVVSGIAGWLLSLEPGLTAVEVRQLLVDTAQQIPTVTYDEDGHHDTYGYGQVSIVNLVDWLTPDTGDTADTGAPVEAECGCDAAGGVPVALLPLLGLFWRRRQRA